MTSATEGRGIGRFIAAVVQCSAPIPAAPRAAVPLRRGMFKPCGA